MIRKNLRCFFVLTAFCLALVLTLSFYKSETSADMIEFWITIDENELKTVIDGETSAGRILDFQIQSSRNGIAVVKTTNGQLEQLSTLMHEHFHKCG